MHASPLLKQLIEALRCLPSVGPKSAQRMAFQLLERGRENGRHLADSLNQAMNNIKNCQRCRNFSESDLCELCTSPRRDHSLLCIVESAADINMIEQTNHFKGLYFVLMGHLSPLDGIGPDDIGIDQLKRILSNEDIKEIILATNPTVEGETTAHYIAGLAKQFQIKITRIAQGVPLGSELEYIDSGTLALALNTREIMEEEV